MTKSRRRWRLCGGHIQPSLEGTSFSWTPLCPGSQVALLLGRPSPALLTAASLISFSKGSWLTLHTRPSSSQWDEVK